MPSFLTFTLINLKHQLMALTLEQERYPERGAQIDAARAAIEDSIRRAVLRREREEFQARTANTKIH